MTTQNDETRSSVWNALSTGLRIKGARVYIHWTFLLLLSLHLILAFVVYYSWSVFWYELILYGPFLFLTVLVHEASRLMVAYKLGGTVESIVLWPLGGLTVYGPDDKGPMGDFKVAIAGPFSYIMTGGVFALLYTILKSSGMPRLTSMKVYLRHLDSGFLGILSTACRVAFCWNGILFLMNLLIPVHPLDGIRVWAGLLRSMGVRLTNTAKIVSFAGMAVSLSLFLYGCVRIFDRRVESGISEILLGGLGFTSSKILYDMVRAGRLSEDPVFGRPCYVESSTVEITSSSNVNVSTTVNGNMNANVAGDIPIQSIESSEII